MKSSIVAGLSEAVGILVVSDGVASFLGEEASVWSLVAVFVGGCVFVVELALLQAVRFRMTMIMTTRARYFFFMIITPFNVQNYLI